jgi:hypothetical protein
MGRDWRIDTLRGYFLVCMTLGHFSNPLAPFTEYTFGYASSPDGFVFLSGLVSSWVYLPLQEKRGTKAMAAKVYRRAATIYLTHLALVMAGIFAALHLATASRGGVQAWHTFVSGALLTNQAGFDRILPMYVVFLACTPAIFKQFTSGRAWVVGAISVILWTASQFGLGDWTTGAIAPEHGNFNVFAWQAYFVAGQYLGWTGTQLSDNGLRNSRKSRTLLAVSAIAALLLMADRHLGLFGISPWLRFSGHPDHNPVRFIDAACLGYLIWRIPRGVDIALIKLRFFQFLNLLGRHSLQVFAFSMLLTRFEAHTIERFPWETKLVATLLTVFSLSIPALLHERWRETFAKRTLALKVTISPTLASDQLAQEIGSA